MKREEGEKEAWNSSTQEIMKNVFNFQLNKPEDVHIYCYSCQLKSAFSVLKNKYVAKLPDSQLIEIIDFL